jgi:hypothetical protein
MPSSRSCRNASPQARQNFTQRRQTAKQRASPLSPSPRPAERTQNDLCGGYIRCSSKRERIDRIIKYLEVRHGWSIKDVIRAYVTEHPVKKGGHTTAQRAKNLSNWIYGQPEVVEQLQDIPSGFREAENNSLVQRLRLELNKLEDQSSGKGALGRFDSNMPVDQINLDSIAQQVQEAVPELWALLSKLVTAKKDSGRNPSADNSPLVMIIAIMTYTRAPILCNRLQSLLGVYLHSAGVKRRVLSVLNGLGITTSYTTTQAHREKLAEVGKVSIFIPTR